MKLSSPWMRENVDTLSYEHGKDLMLELRRRDMINALMTYGSAGLYTRMEVLGTDKEREGDIAVEDVARENMRGELWRVFEPLIKRHFLAVGRNLDNANE